MSTETPILSVSRESAMAIVEERKDSPEWQAINRWERQAAEGPQQMMPLDHVFTPGLYTRIIFIPAGTKCTTRIHLTEHPYVILSGTVAVWADGSGWHTIGAPFVGVTKPGTRRVIYAISDTIWMTTHANPENETDWEKIGEKITYDPVRFGHLDDVPKEKMDAIRLSLKGESP